MRILEELLGHESVKLQIERQRRKDTRAWIRKIQREVRERRRRSGRKRRFDERMHSTVTKIRNEITTAKMKLPPAIRRDPQRRKEADQQIGDKVFAPYLA